MERRRESDTELGFPDRIKQTRDWNLLVMRMNVVVSPIEAFGIVVLSKCCRSQPMQRERLDRVDG